MPATQFGKVIQHIHHMAAGRRALDKTDRQLLDAFLARHEQDAFATLVSRHGPMVYRVCRRVLHHEQDAEDAFQAVFLVLARNGKSIRKRKALAEWLHGIAYRTAMKAKRSSIRRSNHEAALQSQTKASGESPSWDDVQVVLDEEIQQLPNCYKAVFILCVLQEKTGPQAARELDIPVGTVSSRLTWARKRLQQRLARRGIELSAVLVALSVADSVARAMPARLTSGKLLAAMVASASGKVAGSISPQVHALATGISRALLLSKAKLVSFILLTAGVLVAGGAMGSQAIGGRPTEKQGSATPQAAKVIPAKVDDAPLVTKANEEQGFATYGGRVLDPDGKPFAGAKVFLLYYTPKELPVPLRATTNPEGRFRFEVAKSTFDKSASARPWDEAILVAKADGFGLGMPDFSTTSQLANLAARTFKLPNETLRLIKDDVPIAGRILDIEGKPCAGAAISVQGLQSPKTGDLGPFLKAITDSKVLWPSMRNYLDGFEGWIGRDLERILPPVVTNGEGRFVLRGIGNERLVQLSVSGPTITTTQVFATTHVGQDISVPNTWNRGYDEEPTVVHSSSIELVLHPSKPIVGVVMDKDTHLPLAGALVKGSHPPRTKTGLGISRINVSTRADQQGHYTLTGLPKGAGNLISAAAPDGLPYLSSEKRLGDTPGLEPIKLDISLKRGVWITGRVFDKATGQPVHSQIEYGVFDDNTGASPTYGLAFDNSLQTNAATGEFRIVGVPGHGLIGARAFGDAYPRSEGNDIKGDRPGGLFMTVPMRMVPSNYHGLLELNIRADVNTVTANIPLEKGRTLSGTVFDPAGKPQTGCQVSGLRYFSNWESQPLPTSEFTLINVQPGKPRLLEFAHPEKHLAGYLLVNGNEPGPLTVKLGPEGVIKGRLVTKDGDPVVTGEIFNLNNIVAQPGDSTFDPSRGMVPRNIRPNEHGRIQIDGLAPGLKYKLGLLQGVYVQEFQGRAGDLLSVKPGETVDLGDIEIKPNN